MPLCMWCSCCADNNESLQLPSQLQLVAARPAVQVAKDTSSAFFRAVVSVGAILHQVQQMILDNDAIALLLTEHATYAHTSMIKAYSLKHRLRLTNSVLTSTAIRGPLLVSKLLIDDDDAPYDAAMLTAMLPRMTTLTSLHYGRNHNTPLIAGTLPSSLRQIVFGHSFNQPLSPHQLPSSLTELIFGTKFNQPIEIGTLPPNLEILWFGAEFNSSIAVNSLPSNLKELRFGLKYNQIINNHILPKTLISLEFGRDYNQKFLTGVLPDSLITLILSSNYTYPLTSDILPPSLVDFNKTKLNRIIQNDSKSNEI